MNAPEMHIAFKQGLDKFDSLNYPDIEPEEIDLLLNQAQDAFIKQRYSYNNLKKEPFERTQKRIEDLKNVIRRVNLPIIANDPTFNIDSNAVNVDLPSDHWITVQEKATITYNNCNGNQLEDEVIVIATQHNDYSRNIKDPFNKPTNDKVLRLMTENGVELLHSPDSTVIGYKLTYIKEPLRIFNDLANPGNSQDCELSPMVHQEIVNLAISIALENIEAQRIETFVKVTEARQE